MPRPTVSGRRPSATPPAQEAAKRLDDLAMRTVTTAIRRDLWRELNKLAIDQEVTIQAVMNRAVAAYLKSQNYTVGAPLDEG